MATLHLLGTGAAFTDANRTTTMLAVREAGRVLVIDCGGDVIQRLQAAGIQIDEIEGLIVTHEHPDHVSGFALFMEKIWLFGRKRPIPVYGISEALAQASRCLAVFDTSTWDLPTIVWYEISKEAGAKVMENDTWLLTAAPGKHGVPVVGLRIESRETGGVVVYSCDTEPCDSIAELAVEADILVHEANGEQHGHTSIIAAARIAESARARELILVHLPPAPSAEELETAREIFARVRFAEELDCISF